MTRARAGARLHGAGDSNRPVRGRFPERGQAMTARSFRYPAVAVAAALVILGAWPRVARADIVVLADGRKIEGTVKREGDVYVITGRFGTTTRVPVYEVAEIRKSKSSFDDFTKKRDALEAKGDKATAQEWFELAAFAAKQNLTHQARETYEKVISLDPAHERAHKALGDVRYEGTWMTEERAMALKGMVKVGGRWVPRQEATQAIRERSARRRERSPDRKSMKDAVAKAFAIEYETCPKCSGSGIEIWIKCHQCDKSRRPGYSWFGDCFRMCKVCRGTAKVPGIRCRYCIGKGRIDPNKSRTPRGRVIGKGFRPCPDCNGSGGLEWQRCHQCDKSPHPGLNYFGDHYEVCHKCLGTGRRRALKCNRCLGGGIVREER